MTQGHTGANQGAGISSVSQRVGSGARWESRVGPSAGRSGAARQGLPLASHSFRGGPSHFPAQTTAQTEAHKLGICPQPHQALASDHPRTSSLHPAVNQLLGFAVASELFVPARYSCLTLPPLFLNHQSQSQPQALSRDDLFIHQGSRLNASSATHTTTRPRFRT